MKNLKHSKMLSRFFYSGLTFNITLATTLHLSFLFLLNHRYLHQKKESSYKRPVKITVSKIKKTSPEVIPQKESEIKKIEADPEPPPSVKKKIKPPSEIKSTHKKSKKEKVKKNKKIKVVQGLKAESFSSKSSGISAPYGNTLLAPDQGIRTMKVDQITEDLSSPAILISYTPPAYTEAALDAEIEGKFPVDVYIDKKGSVIKAKLRRKIGFGMDQKVLNSVYQAKYRPRKNKSGLFVESWSTLICTLLLD
ncbi:MAG: energy transducer TonB [Deltaproteobacteria bacterium]|nr:energy transducer TonB [Deltaproteobacteria bacterium]